MSVAQAHLSNRPAGLPPFKLMGQISAYRTTQCIRALVDLGIPALLEAGPRSLSDLAQATGTKPELLERVLTHLVHEEVIAVDDQGRYVPSPVTCYLTPDHPQSLRNWVSCELDPLLWRSWESLTEQLRTGNTAFDLTHGSAFFEWHAQDSAAQSRFDAQMNGASRGIGAVVVKELTFAPDTSILDVGGGNGSFLAQILDKNPMTRGTLFELPRSVEDYDPLFAEMRRQGRANVKTGSFFESVPSRADVYLFSRVFHDFDDTAAATILQNTRKALSGHERLYLIDMMAGGQDAGSRASSQDIFMLAQLGGRERTAAEFSALLADNGFETLSVKSTASPVSILEFRPA
ncbi:methyltransferase [Roseibium suaedae]|uniref:Hydroxyneurosporene-O-methyltransferase n=1 Tax=Roseibium suaedae TaxID=735517 RepID=A0A1M7MUQ9_9HYPH|nr:methyltransferase [Roseibium suaedae]SHM94855.1 hydroxyneurosporene-O-methyltransferase [Roseibium suaedae]